MKPENPTSTTEVSKTTAYLCSIGTERFAIIYFAYRRFKSLAGFRIQKTLKEYRENVPPEERNLFDTIESIVNAERWYRRQEFRSKPWYSSGKGMEDSDSYLEMINYQRRDTIVRMAEKEMEDVLKSLNLTWTKKEFRNFRSKIRMNHRRVFIQHLKHASRQHKKSRY